MAFVHGQYDPMKFARVPVPRCAMFRLTTALGGYREAGSLNGQVNLFGFVDDHTFLTSL
jgi:hypothetical protein